MTLTSLPSDARRRIGGWLLRLGLYPLLALGAIAMMQDKLLYFPDSAPLAQVFADARQQGLQPWPSSDDYRALRAEPPAAAAPVRATLLLLHGNAGQAGDRAWYAAALAPLGVRVLLAEYPGYGARAGDPGEAALVADALASLRAARRDYAGPLILAGESLGAGVAAAVAAQAQGEFDALLLITPWRTLAEVARHHYPWLPVGLLLRDRYDSAANLAACRAPVAVVLADGDEIVPAAQGEALFAGLTTRKQLWRLPGAAHNDWMMQTDVGWWRGVIGFLLN